MNGQDKEKHMTHRIKEHIICGHDDIKDMTHRMRERNPNGQVRIKRRTLQFRLTSTPLFTARHGFFPPLFHHFFYDL